MSDDAPTPGSGQRTVQDAAGENPHPATGPEEAEGQRTGSRSRGLWFALAALVLLCGIQGAGLLLRDRVEGRLPRLDTPPEASQGPAGLIAPGGEVMRFGPQVREVTVASTAEDTPPPPRPKPGPAASSPEGTDLAAAPQTPTPVEEAPQPGVADAPPPTPTAQQDPAPAPEPEPEPEPEPTPPTEPPETERSETTPEGAGAGTHVLQMGVFRSQLYRREVEQQLDRLEVPHYRVEGSTEGTGYRVAVSSRTPQELGKARGVLDDHGYAFQERDGKIEAVLYLEQEAQHVLTLLTRSGLAGGYGRVEGKVPLWTVFAGPFDLEEARAVRDRLKQEGLQTFLRKRP